MKRPTGNTRSILASTLSAYNCIQHYSHSISSPKTQNYIIDWFLAKYDLFSLDRNVSGLVLIDWRITLNLISSYSYSTAKITLILFLTERTHLIRLCSDSSCSDNTSDCSTSLPKSTYNTISNNEIACINSLYFLSHNSLSEGLLTDHRWTLGWLDDQLYLLMDSLKIHNSLILFIGKLIDCSDALLLIYRVQQIHFSEWNGWILNKKDDFDDLIRFQFLKFEKFLVSQESRFLWWSD